ncbi:hypothetical protein N7495_007194 [Penicillium taxi]|uniref:uncharacterized protein n=1 Tax=Penicillium taxi TaxID=168475 RepID=UPI0025456E94|nr:uncharacterized protein N7495_007194 [Penicillium taxi]KAJ5895503.1 hypothetical protein N7495_007194 [Penicillium taxi]
MAPLSLAASLTAVSIIAMKVVLFPIFIFTVYVIFNEAVRWSRRIKGLKGPVGLPIVGNLLDINKSYTAEKYRQWSLKYGPVYQIQLGNSTVVIVNAAEDAKTLFLNQTSSLISRPLFHIFHKLVTKDVASIGTSPWNESCKNRRKAAAASLNRPKVQSYEPLIIRETADFIGDLTVDSRNGAVDVDFADAIQRLSLNTVMSLNYGIRIANTNSMKHDYSEIIEVESEISRLRSTSKNLSNYIPLLQFLEPIFWKKSTAHAADIGNRRIKYNNELLQRLKDAMAQGVDKPCIQGNVLRDPEATGLSNNELLSISLSMMAGADSIQPAIGWAFLLLAHRKDIQKRAFEEFQSVVKDDYSLHETKDVEYILSVVKETLRFYSPVPLSMPRESTAPLHYKDTIIPKGTMVFLNAWACNHDPALFPEPWQFLPERWQNSGLEKHAHQFAFGYGSRMCIATHLATRLIYTVIYHTIANFEIHPALNATADEWDSVQGLKDPNALSSSPRASKARFTERRRSTE